MSKQTNYIQEDENPVSVRESPVCKIKRCGNLTGNIRIIRDRIADIYNCIQDWDRSVISGISIVIQLQDLKLKESYPDTDEQCHRGDIDKNIQILFDKLGDICNELKMCVNRMENYTENLKAIGQLEKVKNNNNPLFLTWPSTKFGEVSERMCTMYQREVDLKSKVKESLGLSNDADKISFYVSSWIHEPYIDENDLNMKAMLEETGLLQEMRKL